MQPKTGRGHRLAVDMVAHIACRKDALGALVAVALPSMPVNLDVTVFHLQLAGEDIRIGFVANGDEYAGKLHIGCGCRPSTDFTRMPGHAAVITQYSSSTWSHMMVTLPSFSFGQQAVLQDFFARRASRRCTSTTSEAILAR